LLRTWECEKPAVAGPYNHQPPTILYMHSTGPTEMPQSHTWQLLSMCCPFHFPLLCLSIPTWGKLGRRTRPLMYHTMMTICHTYACITVTAYS